MISVSWDTVMRNYIRICNGTWTIIQWSVGMRRVDSIIHNLFSSCNDSIIILPLLLRAPLCRLVYHLKITQFLVQKDIWFALDYAKSPRKMSRKKGHRTRVFHSLIYVGCWVSVEHPLECVWNQSIKIEQFHSADFPYILLRQGTAL